MLRGRDLTLMLTSDTKDKRQNHKTPQCQFEFFMSLGCLLGLQHAACNTQRLQGSTRRAGTRKRQRDMFDKTAVHCSAELPSLPNQPKADGALSLTKAHEHTTSSSVPLRPTSFSSGSQDRKEESSAGWNPAGRRMAVMEQKPKLTQHQQRLQTQTKKQNISIARIRCCILDQVLNTHTMKVYCTCGIGLAAGPTTQRL